MIGAKQFCEFYTVARNIISNYLQSMSVDWVEKHCLEVLDYSTKGGKLTRGVVCASAFIESTGCDPDSEEAKIGYTIGWVLELMQAAFLIADDFMDQSETRRGMICWYKIESVNEQAVNDAMIVENLAFVLLDSVRSKLNIKSYARLVQYLRTINTITTMGQTLDFINKTKSFESYEVSVRNKTSHYSLCAPIILGLIASQKFEVTDKFESIEKFALRLGYYFQVQDDYFDVYGDPQVTGKIGSDIKDGKNTWLFCKAYELANDEQKKTLDQKIGHEEFVEDIKKLYEEIKVKEAYHEFETNEGKELYAQLNHIESKYPKKTIEALVKKIVGRVY
ncbi:Polyprenyl synthetase family protein [Trichomonas vaginalis G3]|uniref:Polyprenyl synthetase family protein n=1 Tax=Trichomonas vaginalis (strain ATCC PRA-98 / G3) TaxID=412133 RepID=A2DRR1_TRIV3|nr:Polyprenyl synthetase family protein [Trichomonas vaginalis G3]|eukprot:XP_001329081.1 Polyprenyl synthetase family protein [Trichomonas vaginalis G3]